jgi:hypothetical protein
LEAVQRSVAVAVRIAGSQAELARMIGYTAPAITQLLQGSRGGRPVRELPHEPYMTLRRILANAARGQKDPALKAEAKAALLALNPAVVRARTSAPRARGRQVRSSSGAVYRVPMNAAVNWTATARLEMALKTKDPRKSLDRFFGEFLPEGSILYVADETIERIRKSPLAMSYCSQRGILFGEQKPPFLIRL